MEDSLQTSALKPPQKLTLPRRRFPVQSWVEPLGFESTAPAGSGAVVSNLRSFMLRKYSRTRFRG